MGGVRIWLVLGWLAVMLYGGWGFSGGAPGGVCLDMVPVHEEHKPQQGSSPFSIGVSGVTNQGEETPFFKVTVSSSRPFKGLMMQARSQPHLLLTHGRFTQLPPSLQLRNCQQSSNSYVTHKDSADKQNITLEWESPAEFDGTITFVATIVERFDTIWTGVRSAPAKITKRSSDSSDHPSPIPAYEKSLYEGCGEHKKCLEFPRDCIQSKNCQAIVTVRPYRGRYEFEMLAKNSKYVAVGLSEDNIMGGDGDLVVECVWRNFTQVPVEAFHSWNIPNQKKNKRLDDVENPSFELRNAKYENGAVYCSLIHDEEVEVENRMFNLERTKYHLLLAAGTSVTATGVGFHDNAFIVSPNKARLNDLSPPVVKNDFYDGCNVLKNCFGVPNGCVETQNCQAAVSVEVGGSRYKFALIGKTTGYVAVGLSNDQKMGDDSVVECINSNESVQLFASMNIANGKNNVREGVDQDGINLLNSSYTDGILYCEFTRDEKTSFNGKIIDLKNNEYFMLLAAGSSLKEYGVGYHDIIFTSTSEKRLLSYVTSFSETSQILLRLHGAFMIIAWLGCASTGIIIARYYKQTWVGKSLCGKDIWFTWHRFFMLVAWCLTIAGFILIFVEIGEWVDGGSQLHAILGCVTTAFAFIQPIGAAFRPAPSAPNRPIFNWFHWFFGNTAYVFAIATVFFAVPLSKAQLPEWFNWLLGPHIALYIISHLLLSVNQCCSRKSTMKVESHVMNDLQNNSSPQHIPQMTMDAPNSRFGKIILTLFVLGTIILVTVIVFVVLNAPVDEKWRMLLKQTSIP